MMWYERCTGIVEVKGSKTVQAWFFFRLSFHSCKSCVYNCDDLLSHKTFVCHMHTPPLTPPAERTIAWWAKKEKCVGLGCDEVWQKRFHCELSLMLGGHINPTKIPKVWAKQSDKRKKNKNKKHTHVQSITWEESSRLKANSEVNTSFPFFPFSLTALSFPFFFFLG